MSRKEFLASIKEGAIQGWVDYRILPSITGAQACLESADGTSVLAQSANNIFGIKGNYNRYGYLHDTWEVDSNGNRFESTEWFRYYPDMATSVIDHGEFFTSTEWRKKNYKDFVGERDYKKAADALKDAGYATDPKYPQKLVNIIQRENLEEWDKEAFALVEGEPDVPEGVYHLGDGVFEVKDITEEGE